MFKKIQKSAFTLAEVLITLTIIGVIAAMTIPTLMSRQNDLALQSKLKKAQSILANALSMAAVEGLHSDEHSENTREAFKLIKGTRCGADGTNSTNYACSPFSESVISEDGFVYGTHYTSDNAYIGVAFKIKRYKGWGGMDILDKDIYEFDVKDKMLIIPSGAPTSRRPLKVSDACPVDKNQAWYGGDYGYCTYWTIVTGKSKKAAGEWDDKLGTPPNN